MTSPVRPRVLVVGPTPPPFHGPSVFTRMVVESERLRDFVDLLHVDTADRRDLGNLGRFDVRNVALALRHVGRVAWISLRRRPDVVWVQPSQNSLAYLRDGLMILAAWLAGSRVVAHLHGEAFAHFRANAGAGVRAFVDATHALVSEIWVLGTELEPLYAGLVDASRIRVVPNGIPDTRRVDRSADAGGPQGDATTLNVLALGILASTKGTDLLLRAAGRARERGVPVRLVLAGDWASPADERELRAVFDEVGAGEWATLAGVVSGHGKQACLERADVLTNLSRFPPGEGQPLAILEAMEAGVAVVATPRGAVPETLEHGRVGVLVPDGDPEATADALERLWRDPEARRTLAEAGRARFLTEYTESACIQRIGEALVAVAHREPRA